MKMWSPLISGSSRRSRSGNSEIGWPSFTAKKRDKSVKCVLVTLAFVLGAAGDNRGELGRQYEVDVPSAGSVRYVYDQTQGAALRVMLQLASSASDQEQVEDEEVAFFLWSSSGGGVIRGELKETASATAERTVCLDRGEGGDRLEVELRGRRGSDHARVLLQVVEVKDFVVALGDSSKEVAGLTTGAPFLTYLDLSGADADLVQVTVTSDDATCAVVSLHQSVPGQGCPPGDDSSSKGFAYQTMLGLASFVLERDAAKDETGIFVSVSVAEDDSLCYLTPEDVPVSNATSSRNRVKSVLLSVEEAKFRDRLPLEIGFTVAFFSMLCVMAIVATWVHSSHADDARMAIATLKNDRLSQVDRTTTGDASSLYTVRTGSTTLSTAPSSPFLLSPPSSADVSVGESSFFLSMVEEGGGSNTPPKGKEDFEIDRRRRHESDGSTPPAKYVSELRTSSDSRRRQSSNMYLWLVFIMGFFYGVPAFQVVLGQKRALSLSGDQDLCYYNHLCAIPVSSSIRDFNHVFSNVWYVGLGALFAFLTWYRKAGRERFLDEVGQIKGGVISLGVPQQYGVFYAMAVAMVLQGAHSACYHVCPTEDNFQFDTTFMYVISALSFVKVYQFRHADASAGAAAVFFGLGLVVFLEVVGISHQDSPAFWILLLVVYLCFALLLGLVMYQTGRLTLPNTFRLISSLLGLVNLAPRPAHYSKKRLALACVLVTLNLIFLAFGAALTPGVGAFLLAAFVSNLGAYVGFYVAMKVYHGERLTASTYTHFVLALATWAGAFAFYARGDYATERSPAQSRQLNADCLVLGVFDNHDVWHVLSASGLFFCFMLLLTVDDGVQHYPTNKLHIF